MSKQEEKEEMSKLNQICFWLINKCIQTNADSMKITQENVNFKGELLGNWEIIVRKKEEEQTQ